MTSRRTQHEAFEELAAGWALDALEPEDEQLFLQHLVGCALCERELVAHLETAAQLAWASVPGRGDVPDALFGRIRNVVVAESGPGAFAAPRRGGSVRLGDGRGGGRRGGAGPAGRNGRGAARRPGRASGGRARRGAAVGAAAALVLLLGLVGRELVPGAQSPSRSELVAQALQSVDDGPGRRVPLLDTQKREAAVAVVEGDRVSLVVHRLEQNTDEDWSYVLWGLPRTGAPRAVGSFDVRQDVQVVRDLALPEADDVTALAVTREPGDVPPAQPGQDPVVVGQV